MSKQRTKIIIQKEILMRSEKKQEETEKNPIKRGSRSMKKANHIFVVSIIQ